MSGANWKCPSLHNTKQGKNCQAENKQTGHWREYTRAMLEAVSKVIHRSKKLKQPSILLIGSCKHY